MTDVANPEETNSRSARLLHASSAALFFLLVAVVTSRLFIAQGLSLVEGVTWWISKDGPTEALRRASIYEPTGTLYFVIESLLFLLIPTPSEALLRLPSVVFLAIGVLFAFKSLKSLSFTYAPAFVGVAMMISTSAVVGLCVAQPNALAFMFLSISVCFWIRYLTNYQKSHYIIAVLAGILAIHAHYAYVLGLLLWWMLILVGGSYRAPLGATLLSLLATLPFMVRHMLSWAGRSERMFELTSTKFDSSGFWMLCVPVVSLFIASLMGVVFSDKRSFTNPKKTFQRLMVITLLALLLSLLQSLCNAISGVLIGTVESYAWVSFLIALLGAVACETFREAKSRAVFVSLFFCSLILIKGQAVWTDQGWRSGVEIVSSYIRQESDSSTRGKPAVLISFGTPESENPSWYLGEEGEYLRAITSYYGLSAEDSWLMPSTVREQGYLEAHILPLFQERSELLYIYLEPITTELHKFLFQYASIHGFLIDEMQNGPVKVARFVRIGQ